MKRTLTFEKKHSYLIFVCPQCNEVIQKKFVEFQDVFNKH